ncbi:MAG: hypothetical protein LBJ95_03470 [Oscillospiraceae bacterium]|jgi:hypothetical protein|nr:hypothetical protein [Oscillospiraceae bacterium]
MNIHLLIQQYPQLIKKAINCKNKEDLKQLADKYDINISEKELNEIYKSIADINSTKLSDDEQSCVAGGKGDPPPSPQHVDNSTHDSLTIYNISVPQRGDTETDQQYAQRVLLAVTLNRPDLPEDEVKKRILKVYPYVIL